MKHFIVEDMGYFPRSEDLTTPEEWEEIEKTVAMESAKRIKELWNVFLIT